MRSKVEDFVESGLEDRFTHQYISIINSVDRLMPIVGVGVGEASALAEASACAEAYRR